jgi:hypothetical protein
MKRKGPANPERSFGLSVGTVVCLLAVYFGWRGYVLRAEIFGAVGAVLVLGGWLYPPILKWPSALWWRMAMVLGAINARILLTLIFTLVMLPVSLIWRLIGKDPLERRRDRWPGWTPYPARYADRKHYQRMF